jgi:hypothetical protein
VSIEIIGIRHHSPACARLVAHRIATLKPAAILIEGPSDFNPRLNELLLGHTLPIALYSYASGDSGHGQCWFPFVEYSPEWVALTRGTAAGAAVRFIDLAHWQYRALDETALRERLRAGGGGAEPTRYGRVSDALARKVGADGDHALWDHLFESVAPDDFGELQARLDAYFDEIRGDEDADTSARDHEREAFMAQWLAWAAAAFAGQPVLVVCGGWHKSALAKLWPTITQTAEPAYPQAPEGERQGAYLVPYEYRELDALAGYGAGMQSPAYYQWMWQHGALQAAETAVRHIHW